MTASTAVNHRDAINQIKRTLPVRQVMQELGWHISRNYKRADCGVCGGKGDVSVRERLFHCHKCKAAGDVFSLVEVVKQCDFPTALKYLATTARVPLQRPMTVEERHRLRQQQALHERISRAAVKLTAAERELRLWYRDLIHRCGRKQREVSARLATLANGSPERWRQETESCWGWLAALTPLLREYLTAYSLLGFASASDRARFVLRPALRQGMIDCALLEGFVDDAGKRREVLE